MSRVVFTVVRVLALAATTAVLLAGCGSLPGGTGQTPNPCSAWIKLASGNVSGTEDFLNSVATYSPTDGWAVGSVLSSDRTNRALIEHWNGKALQVTPSPDPGTGSILNGVAMVPGSVGPSWWAVGSVVGSFGVSITLNTLILQNNTGTTWNLVPSADVPGENDQLVAVSADSPTDAWAVGNVSSPDTSSTTPSQAFIEHWDGSTWSIQPGFSGSSYELNGVLALGPNDVWAVGDVAHAEPVAIHWNGRTWTSIFPSLSSTVGTGVFNGIAAVPGTTDLWAVGSSDAGPLVEQWSGGQWAAVPAPGPSYQELDAVTAVSTDDAWAVGVIGPKGNGPPVIEHWNGTRWSVSQDAFLGDDVGSADLLGVTTIPGTSPRRILAVGDVGVDVIPLHNDTLAESIC